jgi:TetR/AcrR family transcriptional regulator, transcriptional repressor of aconitase
MNVHFMPKVSEEHHEARRRQLLDAARRCFARSGFDGTSVRGIYEEAGLSAGSVYLHFRSKDEIVEALAQEVVARIADEQRAIDGTDDPLEGIASLVRWFAAMTAAAPEGALSLRVHAWAAAATHEPIARAFRTGFEGMHAALVAALERGRRAGTITPEVDADGAARLVIASLQGFVLQLVNETGADAQAYAESCIALLGRALRTDAA